MNTEKHTQQEGVQSAHITTCTVQTGGRTQCIQQSVHNAQKVIKQCTQQIIHIAHSREYKVHTAKHTQCTPDGVHSAYSKSYTMHTEDVHSVHNKAYTMHTEDVHSVHNKAYTIHTGGST